MSINGGDMALLYCLECNWLGSREDPPRHAPIWGGFGSRFVKFGMSLDLGWNWPILPCLMVLLNSRYHSRGGVPLCMNDSDWL